MANVILLGVEQTIATLIGRVLAADRHYVEHWSGIAGVADLIDADIVFAGGEPSQYLPLLRRVRDQRPALPFVVVGRTPETSEWLDALEAGATDYYSSPFEASQIHWVMESVLPKYRTHAV